MLDKFTPPQTVSVTLMYMDGTVQPLWTAESAYPPTGLDEEKYAGTRWFQAYGPAGKRVPPVMKTFVSGLPDNAFVILWTEQNELGTVIFGRPRFLLN